LPHSRFSTDRRLQFVFISLIDLIKFPINRASEQRASCRQVRRPVPAARCPKGGETGAHKFTGEMSHLQLSTEPGPAWHEDQRCYTRPSCPELAPMSPIQPRVLFVLRCYKNQATVFQSAWTSPTALVCGRNLDSSIHASLVLAELQLTSMDERHKTSAPNTTLSSKHFLLQKKGKADLPCVPMLVTSGKNIARSHSAGLPSPKQPATLTSS